MTFLILDYSPNPGWFSMSPHEKINIRTVRNATYFSVVFSYFFGVLRWSYYGCVDNHYQGFSICFNLSVNISMRLSFF